MSKIEMCALVCLLAGVLNAVTGASNEFRLDTRTGVWTAAATEKIQYSTAWATNLTASGDTEDATHEIKAVVKVNPCLKTPSKYLVVDMSGGRSAVRWPISYLDEVPSGGWTDEYKTEKLVPSCDTLSLHLKEIPETLIVFDEVQRCPQARNSPRHWSRTGVMTTH